MICYHRVKWKVVVMITINVKGEKEARTEVRRDKDKTPLEKGKERNYKGKNPPGKVVKSQNVN